MKASIQEWMTGYIYRSACKPYLKEKGVTGKTIREIKKEASGRKI